MKRGVCRRLAGALVGAGIAAGCGDDTSGPAPNELPVTQITSGPVEAARVPSQVTFHFFGSDIDGTVREFDYFLYDHPRSVATYSEAQSRLPAPPGVSDSRWIRLDTPQIPLTVLADTLRDPPLGPNGSGEFDRWHTFYVRAIDNEGGVDETPDVRTFQGFTQAPIISLVEPARLGQAPTVPRTFVMNWNGNDPIGNGAPYQAPRWSRWAIVSATLDGQGAPIGFPQALYDLPESAWSPWAAWAADDSSGREAAFLEKVPAGPISAAFVFAVQGRDDSDAITARFDRDTPAANNYAAIVVDGSLPVGPGLTVHARQDPLAAWNFEGTGAPRIDVSTTLDTLTLFWDAPRAASYGAWAREFRYGWNIDPNDNQQWTAWALSRSAPLHVLGTSANVFYLQCRDQLDQRTTAVVAFHLMAKSNDAAVRGSTRRKTAGAGG